MSPDPYWTDGQIALHVGDCVEVLAAMEAASVDAIVTDPPYGLTELATGTVLQAIAAWLAGDRTHVPDGRGFMGRDWDRFVPPPGAWDECMRVLKPGGHLLAFAGPRTVDLMTLSIRIAGFEIRDSIDWISVQGMPKSLNVAKAIASGTGRPEDIRRLEMGGGYEPSGRGRVNYDHGGGSVMNGSLGPVELSGDAARWKGWGTALKPAHEPIVVARKPLAGTVVQNVLKHGTGALNVNGCRVGTTVETWPSSRGPNTGNSMAGGVMACKETGPAPPGRWPPNVLLGPEAAEELDRQSGVRPAGSAVTGREPSQRMGTNGIYGDAGSTRPEFGGYGDQGGAARSFPVFLYHPKATTGERPRLADGTTWPTVKPVDLIRWLVRLVTPPGGIVLDPFAGTGPVAEACIVEGFRCVLIDREQAAVDLIRTRLRKDIQPGLFGSSEAS